jgi:hypothetical protein
VTSARYHCTRLPTCRFCLPYHIFAFFLGGCFEQYNVPTPTTVLYSKFTRDGEGRDATAHCALPIATAREPYRTELTRTRRAPGQAATARSCTVVLCFCSFWCLRLRPREPRARWSRGDRAACAWRWRGRCVGFTEFQEPAAAGETTLSDATSAAVDILVVVFFLF